MIETCTHGHIKDKCEICNVVEDNRLLLIRLKKAEEAIAAAEVLLSRITSDPKMNGTYNFMGFYKNNRAGNSIHKELTRWIVAIYVFRED